MGHSLQQNTFISLTPNMSALYCSFKATGGFSIHSSNIIQGLSAKQMQMFARLWILFTAKLKKKKKINKCIFSPSKNNNWEHTKSHSQFLISVQAVTSIQLKAQQIDIFTVCVCICVYNFFFFLNRYVASCAFKEANEVAACADIAFISRCSL